MASFDPQAIPSYPSDMQQPKVVLLWSSLSTNPRQASAQKKMHDLFVLKQLRFELLDGSQDENKNHRNQFFQISKLRGKYPQVFIVQNNNQQIEFIGMDDDIQEIVDVEQFETVFAATFKFGPPQKQQQPPQFDPQNLQYNPHPHINPYAQKPMKPLPPKKALPNKALPNKPLPQKALPQNPAAQYGGYQPPAAQAQPQYQQNYNPQQQYQPQQQVYVPPQQQQQYNAQQYYAPPQQQAPPQQYRNNNNNNNNYVAPPQQQQQQQYQPPAQAYQPPQQQVFVQQQAQYQQVAQQQYQPPPQQVFVPQQQQQAAQYQQYQAPPQQQGGYGGYQQYQGNVPRPAPR